MIDTLITEALKGNNFVTIAIVILVLLGIIYLIKQAIQSLISTNLEVFKHENSKEIEKLKSELENHKQQLEHIHQVSQPTYQHLFEKKIDVYQSLIEIKSKYPIQFVIQEKNIPDEFYEDFLEEYIKKLEMLLELIKINTLFISDNLLKEYQTLDQKYSKFDNKLYDLRRDNQTIHSEEELLSNEREKVSLYDSIHDGTKFELKSFIKVLDSDTLKIKAKINFD